MKLKRAKSYRKQIRQYEIQFGFRAPYQCLLDSNILEDAERFKIDLLGRLEGVFQGKIKPMITQCCIRHIYATKNSQLIDFAKSLERRRCNHHELESPLSSLECISEVVDPKGSLTNKHRYAVASQDCELRAHLRSLAGCPLVYISKSIVLLEPMNTATIQERDRGERSKFKAGLKGQRDPPLKRKRDDDEDAADDDTDGQAVGNDGPQQKKKKKRYGPKEPNPLSIKKPKKALPSAKPKPAEPKAPHSAAGDSTATAHEGDSSAQRKRRRRHKPKGDGKLESNGETEPAAT